MSLEKAVEATNLTVQFGTFTAVDNITFDVFKGEIFGFLGANGAGKTTTIRVLCGLLVPTSGSVRIAGHGFAEGPNLIKKRVGYMSQRFTLYQDLTVSENLAFTAALRKMDKKTLEGRTKELFDFIGFDHPVNTLVKNLPGGLKQELSLAASLLHDPEIVFLDEPTAGVSPASRARFWTLIRKLASSGKTIFVTTHYMDEAEQCQRIALMRAGQIIALDTPSGLKTRAFPEPLFEVEPHENAGEQWIEELRAHPSVTTVAPYGLRYHVGVKEPRVLEDVVSKRPGQLHSRPIAPSLEDVFIRLVEGLNR